MMKILLTLFVLLFSSSVFAEDISDFEIEGMSIGDSLLDYFSEAEIRDSIISTYYKEYKIKKFTPTEFYNLSFFETYDWLQIHFKPNDNKYIIYGITGGWNTKNISDCYKKQNEIVNDLTNMFSNLKKSEESSSLLQDSDGNNKGVYFDFSLGGYIFVECYDFSSKVSFPDQLRIGIIEKEFDEWLRHGYDKVDDFYDSDLSTQKNILEELYIGNTNEKYTIPGIRE